MSANEQEQVSKMNNFFCGLHLLVSLAECTSTSLTQLEKENLKSPIGAAADKSTALFIKRSESAIIRFIRTACKLLAVGADDKSGCSSPFSTYLKSQGLKNNLTDFRYNRFNIVFTNAGALYALLDPVANFLEKDFGHTNTLGKAVMLDTKEAWCCAGAKALGLFSKTVTGPLWRVLEISEIPMAEMGMIYSALLQYLDHLATTADLNPFLHGDDLPEYLKNYVKKDEKWTALTKPNDFVDDLAKSVIRHICKDWHKLLSRLLDDHIGTGCHATFSEEKKCETQSTMKCLDILALLSQKDPMPHSSQMKLI